jgi:hypothetical protein
MTRALAPEEHNRKMTTSELPESVITVELDIPLSGRAHMVEKGLLRRELMHDPAAVGLALLDAAAAHLGLDVRAVERRRNAPPIQALAGRPQQGMGGYTDLSGRATDIRRALKPRDVALEEAAALHDAQSDLAEADEKPIPIVGNVAGLARNRFLADRLR